MNMTLGIGIEFELRFKLQVEGSKEGGRGLWGQSATGSVALHWQTTSSSRSASKYVAQPQLGLTHLLKLTLTLLNPANHTHVCSNCHWQCHWQCQ
jgi:hypothetical protein